MANNFTFTTLPDTTTPTAFRMDVVSNKTSASEVLPIHSLRATGNYVRFTANIVSAVYAGTGNIRQVLTVSGLTFFGGLLNESDNADRQAVLTALANDNALVIKISGISGIPNGWYRVFASAIASNTITINTFTQVTLATGGTLEGDTPLVQLSRPEMNGAYQHQMSGGTSADITTASRVVIDGTIVGPADTNGRNVGFRELTAALVTAKII